MDDAAYCREVESHLCRQNGGHLIRLVGPAFELVCGWAARGIPLKIALHGIDRHVQRGRSQGPRRRPVRITSCEADVLDAFDEWRRAVGVSLPVAAPQGGGQPGPGRPRGSLAAHIDRVTGRLVARPTDPETPALNDAVVRAIDRLDGLRGAAAHARGRARAELVGDLAELDRMVVSAARGGARPAEIETALASATADLTPFRERMTADVYREALDAAVAKVFRDRLGLPRMTYE